MGGPNNLSEVRLFLHNMFNDKRIITTKSSLLRKFIAFMIVTSRTKKAEARYEQIGGKSPLLDITKSLANKLAAKTGANVEIAMRYTPPFAKDVKIANDAILLPLYPQYSTTTTLSSVEDFEKYHGACKVIEPFYANEAYNNLLVKLAVEAVENANEYDVILSAHGLPQKIVDAGDVYQKHCEEHAQILDNKLKDVGFKSTTLAYQSKVGPMKWLEPSLDNSLESYKNKKVLIVPISFCIDNLETLEELYIEYKEKAHEIGVLDYKVSKCPNDRDEFVEVLKEMIEKGKLI